jgi:hypothetical protein
MKSEYVVVDTISVFKQRYVVPKSVMQEWNEEVKLTDKLAKEWASDAVSCEEVKEFSQRWLGETITNVDLVDTEKVLQLFAEDNSPEIYKEWSQAKILDFINKWKDDLPKK